MELKRPTRELVHLIDTDEDQPVAGETVFALGLGGSLCQIIWTKDSHKDYHAWMPFPKVPRSVKEKLTALYRSGKSWGTHGTEVHSNN